MEITVPKEVQLFFKTVCGEEELDRSFRSIYIHSHRAIAQEIGRCSFQQNNHDITWYVTLISAYDFSELCVSPICRIMKYGESTEDEHKGLVVKRESFFLNDEYKKIGIARAILNKEEEMFRRWGVIEIRVTAADDGLVVWPKKFGYRFVEEEWVFIKYRMWCEELRDAKESEATSVLPDRQTNHVEDSLSYAHLPDEFLRTLGSIKLFKTLSLVTP